MFHTKYILLIDADQRVIDIEVAALKYFYEGEIHTAQTSKDAIDILNAMGRPELIFADFDLLKNEMVLYTFLETHQIRTPVLAYSNSNEAEQLHKNFPLISSILEKPVSVKSFTYLVKGITTGSTAVPTHVPVKISIVLGLNSNAFDYYIRLSGTNYVKVIHKGDHFTQADAEKFWAKGVKEIYISASDSHNFLKLWEQHLLNPKDASLTSTLIVEALEQYEGLGKSMGWSREVLVDVQRTAAEAIKFLSKNDSIAKLLNERLSNPSSKYSRHVGLLSFLTCAIAKDVSWLGESAQLKLMMASLLHDLAVEDDFYDDIESWNSRAANSKDRSPEISRYRLHPVEAAKLAITNDTPLPDVEQILLQHHEKMDGSGFPRGLSFNRIGPLPSLFIMTQELVDFIEEGQTVETSLRDFLTWGQIHYVQGHFKKIFDVILPKLMKDET